MRTALSVLIAFLLIPAVLAEKHAPAATPSPDSLEKLADNFWVWRAKNQPFNNDDIPRIERPGGRRDWSAAAIAKRREDLAAFEGRREKLDRNGWPVAKQVDYRLMGSALARVRWELDINPRWKRDPNFYVDQTMIPLLEAVLVPGPYDEARSKEILTRIQNIPSIVEQGEANLQKPPAPFAATAIQSLTGVRAKLQAAATALRPVTTLQAQDLNSAVNQAADALESYRNWLEKQKPSLPQEIALGRDAYVFFLHNVALLPYTPEQLLTMSQQEWARTLSFETYEKRRDLGVPPLQLVPDIDTWVKKTATNEEAIRKFLEQRGIVTVPAWVQHYTVRPIPAYVEALSDFGETDDFTSATRLKENGIRFLGPPSPQLGFFWVATAEDTRPITVHEGLPGHYLQLVLSWAHEDPIRRHYYDSSANEGLGFYAEEMMMQAGLFDDSPRTREIIYSFMRLRALRVEVDVKLALGQFTLEQGAEYLEHTVPMDRGTARAEATAFATAPGQGISYQIGKLQIFRFLSAARDKQGDAFNLRTFHDFLWKNGNVPIALQRYEYLGLTDDLNY